MELLLLCIGIQCRLMDSIARPSTNAFLVGSWAQNAYDVANALQELSKVVSCICYFPLRHEEKHQ